MNKLDLDYQNLLKDIIENGITKETRNGNTISVFGRQIRHDMKLGFPLLTTKKMYFKGIVTELLWFLRGDTNIKYLVDNDCHIWDGDAYQFYLNNYSKDLGDGKYESLGSDIKWASDDEYPNGKALAYTKEEFINKIKTDDEFAKKWGELGPIYGAQWRRWEHNTGDTWNGMKHNQSIKTKIDQIQNLINDLKTNPDSRRLMVNAWNVGELDSMVLPPCHYSFQFYTRELSLETRYNIWFNNNYETGMERFFDPNNLPDFDNPYYAPTPTRAISLMFNMRSCDFPLGIPANIMSYGILLMMVAKQVNMIPEELIGNFGDCHIYKDQIEGVKEQLTREPYPLPIVKLSDRVVNDLSEYTYQDIILENYQSHPKIYFPLSN